MKIRALKIVQRFDLIKMNVLELRFCIILKNNMNWTVFVSILLFLKLREKRSFLGIVSKHFDVTSDEFLFIIDNL